MVKKILTLKKCINSMQLFRKSYLIVTMASFCNMTIILYSQYVKNDYPNILDSYFILPKLYSTEFPFFPISSQPYTRYMAHASGIFQNAWQNLGTKVTFFLITTLHNWISMYIKYVFLTLLRKVKELLFILIHYIVTLNILKYQLSSLLKTIHWKLIFSFKNR